MNSRRLSPNHNLEDVVFLNPTKYMYIYALAPNQTFYSTKSIMLIVSSTSITLIVGRLKSETGRQILGE